MNVEQLPVKEAGYGEAEYFRRKNLIQRSLMALSGDPMQWVEDNAYYFNALVETDESVLTLADREIGQKQRDEIMDKLERIKNLKKAA